MCDIKFGKIVEGFIVVCMFIGNGFKDLDIVIEQCKDLWMVIIDVELDVVCDVIVKNM